MHYEDNNIVRRSRYTIDACIQTRKRKISQTDANYTNFLTNDLLMRSFRVKVIAVADWGWLYVWTHNINIDIDIANKLRDNIIRFTTMGVIIVIAIIINIILCIIFDVSKVRRRMTLLIQKVLYRVIFWACKYHFHRYELKK